MADHEDGIREPLLQRIVPLEGDRNENEIPKKGIARLPLSALTYAKARTISRHQAAGTDQSLTREPWRSKIATAMANSVQWMSTARLLLPLKAGIAALIASSLRVVPGTLSFLNKNGVWAVITADIVLEPMVGLTFSKGINRALGTLVAAALALGVDHVAASSGWMEPYVLMFFTFLGGAIPTAFKFRRPFRDRWNYAVVMSMITFHLLILSKSEYHEKVKLPLVRMLTIVFGFVIASLVNLLVAPKYAGDSIHTVLSKNFMVAGSALEKCVKEYCRGTVLHQIPEILKNAKLSSHDDLHLCFHEILSADSEIDKLRSAVKFEPCHGKFFWGYPWFMFEDVTDNLRHLLYDIVAMDSCLRAEIQAPMHLRDLFHDDFIALGEECAQILKTVGESIKYMRHEDCKQIVLRAEEFALLLQHKITQMIPKILKDTEDPYQIKTRTPFLLNGNNSNAYSLHRDQERPEPTTADHPNHQNIEASPPSSLQEAAALEHLTGSGHPEERSHQTLASRANQLQKHHSAAIIPFLESEWDIVADRLSALSVIKFASILIEVVAKSKYVVEVVDELAEKAHFDGVLHDNVGDSITIR